MCGIVGAPNKELAFKLYKLNQQRGTYSYGSIAISPRFTSVSKKPGQVDEIQHADDYKYYLIHTRAPTLNTTGFDYENSHPFEYQSNIFVGHNGIINNFEFLKEKYKVNFTVDSQIIPYLIGTHNKELKNIVQSIKMTLEELDGIYGLWIYDSNKENIYLARCASSIYFNKNLKCFSSIQIEDSEMLEEGKIYKLDIDGSNIQVVDTFKFNSPYFVL